MQRRTLLKALLPATLFPTLVVNGKTEAAAAHLSGGEYIMFCDDRMIDIEALAAGFNEPPPSPDYRAAITFIPVHVPSDKTLAEAVQIFALEGNDGQQDGSGSQEAAPHDERQRA